MRGLLISYYHTDRIHDLLEKDTPAMRPVSSKPNPSARLVSSPRIGGLHHRGSGLPEEIVGLWTGNVWHPENGSVSRTLTSPMVISFRAAVPNQLAFWSHTSSTTEKIRIPARIEF